MNKLNEYSSAMKMRDVIERIATNVVNRLRPEPRYALVDSLDIPNRQVTVHFPGEETSLFPVPLGAIWPLPGAVVRLAGPHGSRYIDDVVTGDFQLRLSGLPDVSLSTNGALLIGDETGLNMTMDANEVQARNNGAASSFNVNRDGGGITVGPVGARLQWDVSQHELRDGNNRQFLRTHLGRGDVQLVQYGTLTGTTTSAGLITVTFTEPFTGTPHVVGTPQSGSGQDWTVGVRSKSLTQATFVVWDLSTHAVVVSTPVNIEWFAGGPKNDTLPT